MSDKMQEEFEKSDFYFRGEKPARRIENWLLWKAAWDAALSQPAAVEGWKPLTDTQWLNIVNQDHAYDEYTKDDAVHKAVRLTEARLRMNNTALSTSPLLDKNDQTEGDPVDIDCTNMDAAHWAKAFCEKFPGHDEGLMLAWFASAIMCGWDNAHWKIKESNPQPPQPDSNELVEAAVNRFLGWKLPADFAPDCGISFNRSGDYEHPEYGRHVYEPTGTNLFTAEQARSMFKYCLAASLAQSPSVGLNTKKEVE
jgi:hypothetical protein